MKIQYYINGGHNTTIAKCFTLVNNNSEIHTEKGFLCKVEDFICATPLVNTSNFIGGCD